MPTYDYECTKCGHRFEAFQSMSDKPLTKCPECRGKVKRLIGAGAGLIFKGSGFYITDYRSKDYKEKARSDVGGGEAAKPSETSRPDTTTPKSEAKPPPAPAPKASKSVSKPKPKSTKKK